MGALNHKYLTLLVSAVFDHFRIATPRFLNFQWLNGGSQHIAGRSSTCPGPPQKSVDRPFIIHDGRDDSVHPVVQQWFYLPQQASIIWMQNWSEKISPTLLAGRSFRHQCFMIFKRRHRIACLNDSQWGDIHETSWRSFLCLSAKLRHLWASQCWNPSNWSE